MPPRQVDADDPAWMVDCQRCGQPFRRNSMQGARPKRCEPCKLAIKQEGINKLRESQGQEPVYKAVAEPEPVLAQAPVVAKVEPSWLDDNEAQNMLIERQRRDQGLDELDEVVHPEIPDPEPGEDVGDYVARVTGGTVVEPQGHDGHTVYVGQPDPPSAPDPEPTKTCVAAGCTTPDPIHVNRFCTPHWQQISLETRGVLLGAPDGSPPFDSALSKALRQFRT